MMILAEATTDVSNRLDQLSKLIQQFQQLATVGIAFATTGIGGVVVAWQAIRKQIHAVEQRVEPAVVDTKQIKREVSPEPNDTDGTDGADTLREKVEAILKTLDAERGVRDSQHSFNAENLGNLRNEVDEIKGDIKEMRTFLTKMMGKMAGL